MIQDSINKSIKKSLDMFGQDVLIFKDYKDTYYNRSVSLVKYDRQLIESDGLVSTLADRYKFTMFSEVDINNYIAYKGHFYKVLSVDNTRDNICIVYTEYNANKVPVFSLNVDSEVNLKVGSNIKLNVVAYRDSTIIVNPKITYISSDSSIVSVDSLGNVTALKQGNCAIEVKFNEVITFINVNILNVVYGLELNTYNLELNKNNTYKVISTCTIDGVADESPILTYSSNDNSIANVEGEGNINALGVGSCVITVTYNNVARYINLVVNEVIAPTYLIKAYTDVMEINKWDTNRFTVYNGSVEDTETWCITIDYNGNSSSVATVNSKGNNSITVTNNGYIGIDIILVFTKGDVTLKQIIKLVR